MGTWDPKRCLLVDAPIGITYDTEVEVRRVVLDTSVV